MSREWAQGLPQGMSFEGANGDQLRFKLAIPCDDDGYTALTCPKDDQHPFKLQPDRDAHGDAQLPEAIWCPYCGHNSDSCWEFMPGQLAYARRAMTAAAEQYVHQQLNDVLSSVFGNRPGRSTRGASVSMHYKPGSAPPRQRLPPMAAMETRRTLECESCGRSYAVYGITSFCPGCGRLGSLQEFDERALQQRTRLDTLQDLSEEHRAKYLEAGVLSGVYESTVKDAFTSLEVLLKTTFESRSSPTRAVPRGAFQRLADAAQLYLEHLGIDLIGSLGDDWTGLTELAQLRHVLTHNNGIVDAEYKKKVPASTQPLGAKLIVTVRDAEEVLRLTQLVAAALR